MRTLPRLLLSTAAAALVALAAAPAHAIGTNFTYQGQLTNAGAPLSGTVDIQFSVWNAVTGGVQQGATITRTNVSVTNGLVTQDLDFGAGIFNAGADRWVQIAVRNPAGSGSYVTLTPRQPVTPAPYAQYAANAPGSGLWQSAGAGTITNTAAGSTFVGINRTSRISGAESFGIGYSGSGYGGMYISSDTTAGLPFYGYSTAGGNTCWTYMDGATGRWNVYNAGDRLSVTTTGRVGINDTTPAARLSVAGTDLVGINVNSTAANAITASTNAAFSYGVQGTGTSAGVYGISSASNGAGVLGVDDTTGGTGVRGETSGNGAAGVAGYGNFGTGVYGQTSSGYGVYGSNGGSSTTGYAGYFNGRVNVQGNFTASSKSFKIDHPLDPDHKFLLHTSVESPDMKTIYDGVATLGANGDAVVTLPDWFEALNQDFRYQLTCVGGYAPVFVSKEVSNHIFTIAGGKAGLKVSWQLTGIRHDTWAESHRTPVEMDKTPLDRGLPTEDAVQH